MPKVLVLMSMSLDGFVLGADVSRETAGSLERPDQRWHAHRPEVPAGWRRSGTPPASDATVLGAGTRHFDETPLKVRLRPVKITNTPLATHLTYQLSAAG